MRTGRRSVVTIGAYDGVHIGHRKVIDTVRRLAAGRGLQSVVVTFDRHPASVVRPDSAPKLLCDLEQKLELLRATGVDEVVVIPFDHDRANEPAEEFVEEVLGDRLAAALVVVGRDFHFGRGRGGDVAMLEKMGAALGFEVIPYGLVPDPSGGEIVSSTGIRRLIAKGDMGAAARLLGRPHEVRGPAVWPHRGEGSSGESHGARSFWADVPTEILRPPPGSYPVMAGLVATAEGKAAPAPGRALVPADAARPVEVTPIKAEEAPPGSSHYETEGGADSDGRTVRVLFTGKAE